MVKTRKWQKGFTLIELLVVVAILGVLAAVAVPNVAKFINRGRAEAANTELHNIQTSVTAMLADDTTGVLYYSNALITSTSIATDDMSLIGAVTYGSATPTTPDKFLKSYCTGLNTDGTTKSGHTYTFNSTSMVEQQ